MFRRKHLTRGVHFEAGAVTVFVGGNEIERLLLLELLWLEMSGVGLFLNQTVIPRNSNDGSRHGEPTLIYGAETSVGSASRGGYWYDGCVWL
jgi:hypothetical protein